MTARQYVKMLGAKRVFDSDYDLDEKQITIAKLTRLQKFHFKLTFFKTLEEGGVHIHAPMRKVKSWFDRGWGWQLGVKAT